MDNLNYGVVGNCKSAALISKDGSLDWLCLPAFDSTSCFAKILDEAKGGFFGFEVEFKENYNITQSYIHKTNILVTNFKTKAEYSTDAIEFEICDFMPRFQLKDKDVSAPPELHRVLTVKYGRPRIKVQFYPALEYAEFKTEVVILGDYIKAYTTEGPYNSLYLYSSVDKSKIMRNEWITFTGSSNFVLSYNQKIIKPDVERSSLLLHRTQVHWLNWTEGMRHFKYFNEEITRSALVLKLLSFEKTGAFLAALTTSLPETIGEVRNWDYRFCWIRDASMVVKVLSLLGKEEEAHRYLDFIVDIIPKKDEKIQIMYGIRGETQLEEKFLSHLSGYQGSFPVRIGNAAYEQKQNDIYGVLVDVIYLHFLNFSTGLNDGEYLWTIVRGIMKKVAKHWREPDKGIWEIRNDPQHFTFSKVMCWVAADRSVKIAKILGAAAYVDEWTKLAKEIKEDVYANGWNEKLQAFTQYYGADHMDASNLLFASLGFIHAKDERYISTVRATKKELFNNGLMYRYINEDDFGLPSSSFTICTFWLVQSLYLIGDTVEAKSIFDTLVSYSNHLGLFSEDLDFSTKRLLGNFPQAYSHLALIENAILLSSAALTSDSQKTERMMSADF